MPEWLLQGAGYIALAGAVYGGIRSDIKYMHEQVAEAKAAAARAHERIDGLLVNHRGQ